MKLELLVNKIKKSPTIIKSLRLADTYVSSTDLNSIRSEIKTFLLFKTKVEKNKIDIGFDTGFNNPNRDMESLIKKLIHNQANQDRTVEISIMLNKISNRLDFIYENAKGYIYYEHGNLLDKMTKDGKEYVVNCVFRDMLEFMSELDSTMDSVERVLKNMTNTHYVLMGIKDSGEGIIERSRSKV